MSYRIWEAFIAAGSTVEELAKLEAGGYSRSFVAKVVAWYNMKELIFAHTEDEKGKEIKRKSKNR